MTVICVINPRFFFLCRQDWRHSNSLGFSSDDCRRIIFFFNSVMNVVCYYWYWLFSNTKKSKKVDAILIQYKLNVHIYYLLRLQLDILISVINIKKISLYMLVLFPVVFSQTSCWRTQKLRVLGNIKPLLLEGLKVHGINCLLEKTPTLCLATTRDVQLQSTYVFLLINTFDYPFPHSLPCGKMKMFSVIW